MGEMKLTQLRTLSMVSRQCSRHVGGIARQEWNFARLSSSVTDSPEEIKSSFFEEAGGWS
jgi:hypothetical protein